MAALPVNTRRLKAAVSVSEMAKLCTLSRARFYDLVQRGVFLTPIYSIATRRPFYTDTMAERNLAARQSGIGCNDEYVLFYEKKPVSSSPQRRSSQRHDGLIEGLKSFGLATVTASLVVAAITICFPSGTEGTDESEVLRAVFRHLRRQGLS